MHALLRGFILIKPVNTIARTVRDRARDVLVGGRRACVAMKGRVHRAQAPKRTLSRAAMTGFTLIELMTAIGIVGITIGMGVPAMGEFVANNRMATASSELVSDLQTARSEASRMNRRVNICPSAGGDQCDTAWGAGRVMFVDSDASGTLSRDDLVIRRTDALRNNLSISGIGNSAMITFLPSGMASGSTTFKLCDRRRGDFGRMVSLDATGRSTSAQASCP